MASSGGHCFPSIRFLCLWVVVAQLAVSPAVADMGRLEAFLEHGFSDGWRGETVSGDYWLENRETPGAIRYYYTDYDGESAGSRTISVDVRLSTDDPQARAGLLYGLDTETGHYYLVLLGPEGQLELIRRDASGFNLRMSSSTGADPAGFNQIRIQETGRRIALSVNGRELGGLGNETVGTGAVGIAAVGVGRFGFSDYREDVAGNRAAAPTAGPFAQASAPGRESSRQARQAGAAITWFPMHDPQTGMLIAEIPLPGDWKVTSQAWSAPDGVQARAVAGEFLSGVDTTVDHVIQAKLLPLVQQSGNRVLGIEDYPAIARYDANYSAQLWKFAPSQDQHAAKGVIYGGDNDVKGVIVVHFQNSGSEFGASSFYSLHVLEGPASTFERRKQEFLNALANQRHNPERIAAYNQREQQLAAGRAASFNAQQRQKQQQFDGWMATQRQSSSSVLDSSMESWRRRQDMNDTGHQRQVDAIAGTTPVHDPNTGQTWQVEAGHGRYYINSAGEYIPTDDPFYNPNMDPAVNNGEWIEVTPNHYGR